jgi:hypothetical protein
MLEDFRGHDPAPNREEIQWMSINPFPAAIRFAVFLVVSIAVGGYASLFAGSPPPTPTSMSMSSTAPTLAEANK